MDLSGLLPEISKALERAGVDARLAAGGHVLLGLPDGAKAAVTAALATTGRSLLLVASRPDRARALAEETVAWLGDAARVLLFPERESLPYERLAPDPAVVRDRLLALNALRRPAHPPPVVVASGLSLAQRTLAPGEFDGAFEEIAVGGRLEPEAFLHRLLLRGYQPASLVDTPGQVSRRGGILDVFSPADELPVRIELVGSTVESLRLFQPDTQRSLRRIDAAAFGPAREILLPNPRAAPLSARLDLSSCMTEAADRFGRELALLSHSQPFPDDFYYVPFLASGTLLEFLPADGLTVCDEPADLFAALAEHDREAASVRDDLVAKGDLPAGLALPHMEVSDLRHAIERASVRADLSRWATGEEEGAVRLPFAPAASYGGRLRVVATELASAAREAHGGRRVVVVSQQAPRLAEVLSEEGTPASVSRSVPEPPAPGSLTLVHGSLPQGWVLTDAGDPPAEAWSGGQSALGEAWPRYGALVLLTDSEVFGFVKQRRLAPRRAAARDAFLADLSPGDYVVHIEHGIAKFAGLVRKAIEGHEREYLELRYAERDRLFVPVEQVDRVSRYVGPGDHVAALTRLGSGEWARAKERVRRAVADLAKELLELYAARQVLQGRAFSPDGPWQQELEASFPYVETPDQIEAIRAVKLDMEAARPMDRLVCGDVGYGKTEVAIRAAFKAVLEGMQVAVLVPTTVLAQQHSQTFRERLASFPVRIDMLSRFRSDREQRRVTADLAAGSVDIVVGTHRLLQKDVSFKNLGLVILDEEQRFGVAHKERLKQMRREVDVLTLSATPIPRTLYMSLTGIRDMSAMETPPEERLPIKTYVTEFDERLVREAIIREMERGGQVYFVHNRVHSIELVARRLRDLVPEAEIGVGHGRMPEDQLERVMLDFVDGRVDVLVCTTIIESGLDIPNVNTIIINRADKLGLAQLYQLRGRVGRGASRAYAYLLYDRGRVLSETAQKRLETIFEATELGAGFQIALKDLEIRGAGNLLGTEQSGHIGAVGFDLYVRLLGEAVERLKALQRGETPPAPATAQPALALDLPFAAHLPETYVPDLNLRLALYQRLAEAQRPEHVEELLQEIVDRFGLLPPTAGNLLFAVRLRVLARAAGVQSIQREEGHLIVRMREGEYVARDALRSRAPPEVSLGRTQLRLDLRRLRSRWRPVLADLLEAMAANAHNSRREP